MCKVDTCPDANFSRIYGNENPNDPICVKSRTLFIIKFVDFPFLWYSKLQTKTALLTMEAETLVMDHFYRKFFTIIGIATSPGNVVGLPIGDTTTNFSVQNNNLGLLVLDRTLPPHLTPFRTYYLTKTICFC